MSSQEIVEISSEVSPVVERAQTLEIVDKDTMKEATEFLSKLNIENDRIVEEKEKVTKPLNEALKAERARWAPAEKILKTAIELIRTKMSDYQTALIMERRKEEAKIASRIGEGKGKIKLETASKKLEGLEVIENKTETDSGSVSFRTDYVVEIVSKKDIPLEYMEVKESLILKDLKAGKTVPGAVLKEKLTPVNR